MKSIFQSRTVRLAVLQAIAGGLIIFFTEMNLAGYAIFVKSFADILLRMDTHTSVTLSKD